MAYDDDDWYEPSDDEPGPDPAVEEAKSVLVEFFRRRTDAMDVFYNTQLAVLFEGGGRPLPIPVAPPKGFFHWITKRAANELVSEGRIASASEPRAGGGTIRFYWSPKNRYSRRKRRRIHELVDRISDPKLGLGEHGENMVDAAMGRAGFRELAQNVSEYKGKRWGESEKDLDRVYERDGIEYGVEIKNTLGYIEKEELQEKLRMCAFFGVRPLFVMRDTARSYAYEIISSGGYCFLFGRQLYPFGHGDLVQALEKELELPVHAPRRLEAGFVDRFVRWHDKKRGV